jgi:hypothetical protein
MQSAAPSREDKIAFIQQKMAEQKDPGFLDSALQTAVKVGETIDSYTGAPMRAAIGAAQDAKNPITAFTSQFGEDPNKAPTGKQIAQKAGVPNTSLSDVIPGAFTDNDQEASEWLKFKKGGAADISASGAAGLAMDIAADPTLILPVGQIAKGVGKGVELGAKGAVMAGGAAADLTLAGAKQLPGAKTVGTTLDIVKEGSKNTAEALKTMFAPKVSADYSDLVKIAEKNGIDPKLLPEAIEFGEGSFISRSARNRAEGVLGEPYLKKFEAGLEAVRDATENKIAKIGGGQAASAVEAGELIRKGYDEGVDKFFDQIGMTHNKVLEAIPGLTIAPESLEKIGSKLNGIEKWAKGRAERGFTAAQRAQADQVLRAIDAVRKGNGSYKQTLETLRDIGDVAFKSQNILADIPPDIAKFRELYSTLDDALISTVEKAAGAPVAAELRDSNKAISEFLGDKSVISSIVGNKNMSPEKVFASLVEQGDTKKIEALKKILPPETFQRLKGSFLASQLRKNADDVFTFKSLQNNLRNKKNVLGALLDPSEIDELSELVRLGDRFGSPVLSTSGTGASSLFSDITKGIRSGVESDTVIGLLKDSARNRSTKATKAIESAKETPGLSKSKTAISAVKENDNLKKLAMISPAAARVVSSQYNSKDNNDGKKPSVVLRGQEKWAVDGFSKIMDQDQKFKDPKFVEKIFSDKKGKDLLIQASDLTPGSKAMEKVIQKIKDTYAKGNG